jgi:beta-galactosidase GanA
MKKQKIVFGTQYYRPPFPDRNAWSADLDLIVASGMNTVKLWAVWSWIERTAGFYYFEDLDELMELCRAKGLQVVINVIPEGSPYWLERLHPDARYRSHDGLVLEFSGAANMPSGGWPGLCRDKAEVANLANRFLKEVARRYGSHPNLIALDVWNEPHIDPAFDYPDKIFCYCEFSKRKFVDWLKQKYESVEVINRTWYRAYAGWEDITAPTRFGTYPDMIDWRLFWLENHANWLAERVQAVKEIAPETLAMTHVPFSGYFGGSGKGGLGQTLTDEFLLAQKVEQFGLTSFPKWLMQNDFVQHLMNVELVAAAACGKPFWQSELQSGGGLWGAYGSSVASAEEIRLWNWGALAGGAKGIMYWQWKPEPSGMESPGFGLTELDGQLSVRTKAAQSVARRVSDAEGLETATLLRPVNGIYVSRTSALFTFAAGRSDALYAESLYGVYQAFFDEGIPVRFIHGDQLRDSCGAELKTLYVPAALALSPDELDNLIAFVMGGGTLVVEACTGLFDHTGLLQPRSPLFEEAGGLKNQVVDSLDRLEVTWADSGQTKKGFSGRYYRQTFNFREKDVEVLASFENGEPAVCLRRSGKGTIVWIGTLCSIAGQTRFTEERPMTKWAVRNGYTEIQSLCVPQNTFLRLFRSENASFGLIAINYNMEPVEVRVEAQNGPVSQNKITVIVPGRDGGYFKAG